MAEEPEYLERLRTAQRVAAGENRRDHILRAKQLVVQYWNENHAVLITEYDLYVVWFAFVLGNWKCLISSDAWTDTSYFEVSYNAPKKECYLDHYLKVSNQRYADPN